MSLTAGTRFGSYEVTGPIGAGGMGEVYRAHDTKLHRDVAVKILSDVFSGDADRLARFEREAHLLASLNHPNIAQVHGLDDSTGVVALIMELVPGEDLAQQLSHGPLPTDQALAVAVQIIDALEAAHEQGIVHRDLKPANIKVKEDGTVKVLDFGLAKMSPSVATPAPDVTAIGSTQPGLILGTAAYMAPEQARGRAVDKRADIWAFGAVLYEMLTGRACFARATVSDTVAAVLTEEPDWQRVPEKARPLVQRCLEKDPKHRLRDIGDARLLLETPSSQAPTRSRRIPWIVTAVAMAALAVAVAMMKPRSVPDRPLLQLDVNLGSGLPTNALSVLAFSPDGNRLVFPTRTADGRQVLGLRSLGEPDVTVLEGTAGADQPFFSPDGRWVGFFASGKLKKVPVEGGSPIVLCDTSNPRGATWLGDGTTIVAALVNTDGLWRVDAANATCEPLTKLNAGELTHRWPHSLPGNAGVLFTAHSGSLNSYEDASIDVLVMSSGERRTLWRGGYDGRFVQGEGTRGYLTYVQRGVLFGVPFDTATLKLEGTPTQLVKGLDADTTSGAGRYDYSTSGILAIRGGAPVRTWPIRWLDRDGKVDRLLDNSIPDNSYYSPRISPDGRRLAVAVDSGKGTDIFIHDMVTDAFSRITFSGSSNSDPVWAPSGVHLAFRSLSGSAWTLWWVRADGAGSPQRLLNAGDEIGDLSAGTISPDGRRLIYSVRNGPTSYDLWSVPLDVTDPDHPKAGEPELFLQTNFSEQRPAFSPDGRWVAYTSNESGTTEVYVQPFPSSAGRGGKWQVSSGGGVMPEWSRLGHEIFYQTHTNRVMVSGYVVAGESFQPGKPRAWSERQLLAPGFSNMDVAPDGKRIAVLLPPDTAEPDGAVRVTFLLNFYDEVRRRMGSGAGRRD